MEICVHAGLHKSGTTTVQQRFAKQFGNRGRFWYPLIDGPIRGQHSPLIWPILGRDDEWNSLNPNLSEYVQIAEESGVEQLIISAEALDRVGPREVEPLRNAFGDHVVRVVFTATQPQHRWASVWQEHVKSALGAAPLPAREVIFDSACIGPGRLERLVTIFPAEYKTVVLVRRDRPDPNLVRTVAAALDLPWSSAGDDGVLNQAIGEDIALLAHLNSTGETVGVHSRRSVELFERYRKETAGKRIDQFARWEFDLPSELGAAASAEVEFLRDAPAQYGVDVVDPAGLLDTWETGGLPDWYRALAEGSVGRGGTLQTPDEILIHKREGTLRAQVETSLDEAERARNPVSERSLRVKQRLRRVRERIRNIRSGPTQRWRTR